MKGKKTVLIVDDSSTARMKVANLVEEGNYNAIEAINGNDAYDKIHSENPDCVLLDLLMPELDGTGLLIKLQKEGNKIPIIVVTSDIQEETRKECINYGAFEMINKPIISEFLLSLIDQAIYGKESALQVTDEQLDALTEIINIGVGRSAGSLNKITNKRIKFEVPSLKIVTFDELKRAVKDEIKSYESDSVSAIKMEFEGGIIGTVKLVFPKESALKLVRLLSGDEMFADDMDQIRATTLTEVGNIVLNSLMGAITNILKVRLQFSLPRYFEDSFKELVRTSYPEDSFFILARTHFNILDTDIFGDFIISMEVKSFEKFIQLVIEY